MKQFIEGEDRSQFTWLPECLDDYIGEDNPVRIVDVFVDEIDLQSLGFRGADWRQTSKPLLTSVATTVQASAMSASDSSPCAAS